MKKVLCLILSLLVVFHLSAFAEETINGQEKEFEKLVIMAKNAVNVNEEEYVFDSYSKNNNKLNLSWKRKDESKNGYINVVIDEEGDILNYSKDYKYDEKNNLMQLPSDDKLKYEAKEFLNKVAPLKSKKFKAQQISDYLNSPVVGVSFSRYENEIFVSSSSAYIEINPLTFEVVHYNMNWNNIVDFESTNGILAPSDAIRKYKENLGYELLYRIYADGKSAKSYLTYSPKNENKNSISAKTGEIYNGSSYAGPTLSNDAAMKEEVALGGALSKEEQIVYDELANLPSKEDVIKYAKSVPEFKIDDTYIVENYNVYKNINKKYVCSVQFAKTNEKNAIYKSLSLVLEDFKIVSYSNVDYNAKKDLPKIDEQILKQTSKKFAEKYFEEELEKCKADETYLNGINYKRYENDIRVDTNAIAVKTNAVTGDIESVWTTWHEIEFEKIVPQKSLEDLYAKIINEDSFTLNYVIEPTKESEHKNYDLKEYTAHLVYSLSAHNSFDVNTLNMLNYKGEVQKRTTYEGYKDIDGHYIKEYAEALGKIGVFYEDEYMKPDEVATQKDFVSLLAKMNGYNSDDISSFYKRTADRYFDGDKIDENALLKRIDAIRYAVNYKGYEDIAKISDMFKTHFTDVPSDMVGYASLATGLKIVSDKTDKLNPEKYLTRAEALVIIFNLLNN